MASRTSPPGTDSSPVVDIEDFVVESSVGWRNGSGQASPPVQYRQRDVRGISGGEGVDGPGGGGRSSFEVSVPQQRGDEQNERGHLSLPKAFRGVNLMCARRDVPRPTATTAPKCT